MVNRTQDAEGKKKATETMQVHYQTFAKLAGGQNMARLGHPGAHTKLSLHNMPLWTWIALNFGVSFKFSV